MDYDLFKAKQHSKYGKTYALIGLATAGLTMGHAIGTGFEPSTGYFVIQGTFFVATVAAGIGAISNFVKSRKHLDRWWSRDRNYPLRTRRGTWDIGPRHNFSESFDGPTTMTRKEVIDLYLDPRVAGAFGHNYHRNPLGGITRWTWLNDKKETE